MTSRVPDTAEAADQDDLTAALGVTVDAELLERALTHRSYAYEHGGLPHNERLEFLGDSVLGVVITETLYRAHPDLSEGKLAKLRASVVNMRALADIARTVGPAGLGAYVRLGRGEEATGGRDKSSILADTLESVLGAVFLEHGLEGAARVVHTLFDELMDDAANLGVGLDWKTTLQELTAERRADIVSRIPLGRFVDVDEIARMVAFLCSDDCSFSTGAVFDLSGGRATY